MEQKQKPKRDLSDLKARLGLQKPAAGVPPPGGVAPPGAAAQPTAQPMQPAMPGVVPPPGVQVPGAQPQQPAAPAAPDVRRDPFAPQPAPVAQQQAAPIVDAGPLIDIPEEKKPKSKWFFILIAISIVPLVIGWWCGRIYGGRLVFNRTIDDAKVILDGLKPVMEKNKKIANTLIAARARVPKGKSMEFDSKLVSELEELMATTNIKATKREQTERIFKTNYARMDDIIVSKLFEYYNNTLRLQMLTQQFITRANKNKETIENYHKESTATRNYGIVFASDQGGYFLGKLVQVGPPRCPEGRSQCRPNEVEGFPIRVGSGQWKIRPGKAKKVEETVVPIMPDEDWRQVAMGRPGYLTFKQYLLDFSQLVGVSALLAKDQKELIRNLNKQAKRDKLFAPL